MELKATLQKPYTKIQRADFIVENNHNLNYEIRETDNSIEAWGYTEEEQKERETKQALEIELDTLLTWFTTYDEKCMQYQRSLRLGTTWDDDITKWDALAVTNANRIKEIRKILEG